MVGRRIKFLVLFQVCAAWQNNQMLGVEVRVRVCVCVCACGVCGGVCV